MRRQTALKLAGARPTVNHDVFRRARMHAAAIERDRRLVGVEILVLQLAERAAVQRIGNIRAESGDVK